ncbi:unnamed protein product [Cyberlindnera jadinii]|uniref:Uncharacterized protein n=1 Tax=Cyberlindnera jadinii (strain ATCC 18201 / CBS 1600 / BCRC 20928 / JCM 3617 / NBRC 0987 / NRRL Y-1542) TaxID=983966 RepID=A0A0H5C4X5_CYBJN|nr:unnamed protein product [Cyberlindnera jadinii]
MNNGSSRSGNSLKDEVSRFCDPKSLDMKEKELRDTLDIYRELDMVVTSSMGLPFPASVNLIAGRDYSFEESRWDFIQSQSSNTLSQYETAMSSRKSDMDWCVKELLRDTRKAARYTQTVTEKQFNGEQVTVRPFLSKELDLTGQSSNALALGSGSNPFGSQKQTTSAFGSSGFGSKGNSNGSSSFGQSSFGQSVFGQASSTGAFGSSGFGAAKGSSAFGSSGFGAAGGSSAFGSSGFGQPSNNANSSTSPFGKLGGGSATTTSAFGSSGFGQSTSSNTTSPFAQMTGNSNSTSFGQSGFGSSTDSKSPFGQLSTGDSKSSPFGQLSTAASKSSPFGQLSTGDSKSSPFGQPATSTTSAFGQPTSSAFGQSASTSAFGQPASTSAFGQPTASAFGQSTTNNSPFGQQNTNSVSTFGQSTSSAFGSGSFGFSNGSNSHNTAFTPGLKQSEKEPERVKEDDLSEEIIKLFKEEVFILGKVPEIEPPLVLC